MNITHRRSGTATAATLVLVLLGLTAASARTDAATLLAPRSQKVNALGGRIIWAQRNEAGAEWRLMSRANGVTAPLAIDPFQVRLRVPDFAGLTGPPSADLGVGPRGRIVATYTRCRELKDDAPPAGCDLYLYDFRTARERRLPASTKALTEYLPTVSGDRVVFARTKPDLRRAPRLYWARLEGPRRHALPAARPCTDLSSDEFTCASGPVSLDLSGELLASAWCCGDTYGTETTIRLTGLSWSSDVAVDSGRYDGRFATGAIVSSPSFDDGTLIYGSFADYDTPDFPHASARRIDLGSGRVAGAPLAPPNPGSGLDSLAQIGDSTLYAPYLGPVYDVGSIFPSLARLDRPPPARVTGGSQNAVDAQLASYCWRGRCAKSRIEAPPATLEASPHTALLLDVGATATTITVRSVRRGARTGRATIYPTPPYPPQNADQVNVGNSWTFTAPARLRRTVTVRISVRYLEGKATFLIRLRPGR